MVCLSTLRGGGHSNPTCCNWIHSNFLHSEVVGTLKHLHCAPTHLVAFMLLALRGDLHTKISYLHPCTLVLRGGGDSKKLLLHAVHIPCAFALLLSPTLVLLCPCFLILLYPDALVSLMSSHLSHCSCPSELPSEISLPKCDAEPRLELPQSPVKQKI